MPYARKSDLPKSVRDNLPEGAQTIYRKAFNSAFEQYSDSRDTEERAHKVAWSAVKKEYKKSGDIWKKK